MYTYKGHEVNNPYMIAWLKSIDSPSEVQPFKTYEFINWINKKHDEFQKETGTHILDKKYITKFCKWLGVKE